MLDDEDILEAYEHELAAEPPPVRRSNRGFWLVIVTIGLACVILVGEIFANRPLAESIRHAEHTLRAAQTAAEQVRARTGSYAAADPGGLKAIQPALTYGQIDQPSTGLDDVSVASSDTAWAAAVQPRPGACFYIRLTDAGDQFYGVGETCTGRAALSADQPSW